MRIMLEDEKLPKLAEELKNHELGSKVWLAFITLVERILVPKAKRGRRLV